MDREAGKKNAALRAVEFIHDGMTIGMGTGSTAGHFIDALAGKIREGWTLYGVPTSEKTRLMAIRAGITIIEPDEKTVIDVAVDGADEIDGQLDLVKGGGGALLREKIVASAAGKFIVIADISKNVPFLGAFPVPVEIERFSFRLTARLVRKSLSVYGYEASQTVLRTNPDGSLFLTDGGNCILDCMTGKIDDPFILNRDLCSLPGVIETGIFCKMTDIVIFGDKNGIILNEKKRAP